ncbi:MAG: DUF4101 domain-containing protein [Kastovskya adunca ATA6-11-RM4]|nr:DUF4101 domain-containing protein [Kastovskya adunca ATA6-11-RM4]
MRIPLDYYRILGLPIQATAEQRNQAYRDRSLQLPRREYSEAAIAARKQLLDEAYAVVSDPEKCAAYDASFLAKTYDPDSPHQHAATNTTVTEPTDSQGGSQSPSIEIAGDQFVGALLILHELGEYELVLKLGNPYLTNSKSISLDKGRLGDPHLVRSDIILTVALAYLELGREQWQQGQYENAAVALENGQELLLREGLFPSVRGEIQSDLYKLRPYRILELLALPEENLVERRNGLRLLQDMLQERGGIDGTGDDQSGLSIDDFLRFIQQLRGYLTSAEQQSLFEAEARRPSAVATYLAVYALLARGFVQRQPAWITRAKQMLLRLGRRQDVHLEQAVCALLLGQTEEASRALELSQEYEALAFIREQSQGAPDLLPGLCLYGERWLQKSVFPHFRDLANLKASLKEYFADEQVQAFLEELPAEGDASNEWAVVQPQKISYAATAPSSSRGTGTTLRTDSASGSDRITKQTANSPLAVASSPGASMGKTAAVGAMLNTSSIPSVSTLSPRASQLSSGNGIPKVSPQPVSPSQERSGDLSAPRARRTEPVAEDPSKNGNGALHLPPARSNRASERVDPATKTKRLVILAIAGILGLGALLMLLAGLYNLFQRTIGSSASALEENQPQVQLAQPPITIPAPDSQITAPEGPLTADTAQQVIRTWLSTKSQALGREHQIENLEKILVNPTLSTWQKRSQAAKNSNTHWQYNHDVQVTNVSTNEANPDQASAEATVKEVAESYQNGKLNQNDSYSNDNLKVRYDMVRRDDQWLIRDMAVLN